jgi:hypothetical protein
MADELRSYGTDAVQAIRTASQAHHHLSAMADRKASMLMGASFVVFTILVSQAARTGELTWSMMLLGLSAFLSAVMAAVAVMPAISAGPHLHGQRNLMFFGGFDDMSEDEYIDAVMTKLSDQRGFLEMIARDVYQNGQVLARKKYRLLRLAYSIFIVGLCASGVAFAISAYQGQG